MGELPPDNNNRTSDAPFCRCHRPPSTSKERLQTRPASARSLLLLSFSFPGDPGGNFELFEGGFLSRPLRFQLSPNRPIHKTLRGTAAAAISREGRSLGRRRSNPPIGAGIRYPSLLLGCWANFRAWGLGRRLLEALDGRGGRPLPSARMTQS